MSEKRLNIRDTVSAHETLSKEQVENIHERNGPQSSVYKNNQSLEIEINICDYEVEVRKKSNVPGIYLWFQLGEFIALLKDPGIIKITKRNQK